MDEETEINMFIKHLQAELEDTIEILDLQARELRQWQIEVTIQESLKFLKIIEDRKKLGLKNIFKERDAVRIIKKRDPNSQDTKNDEGYLICPKCDDEITESLGFCESCGYKI